MTENTYDIGNRLEKAVIKTGDTVTLTQKNLYDGNGQRVEKEENGTKTYFYQKDIKGSTTSLIDEAGNGIVTYEYDDFGETTKKGDTAFVNEICYTGAVYDESTGLYYLNVRYYDPVNYTDPSGHSAIKMNMKIYTNVSIYYYHKQSKANLNKQAESSAYYNTKKTKLKAVRKSKDFINTWNMLSRYVKNVYCFTCKGAVSGTGKNKNSMYRLRERNSNYDTK